MMKINALKNRSALKLKLASARGFKTSFLLAILHYQQVFSVTLLMLIAMAFSACGNGNSSNEEAEITTNRLISKKITGVNDTPVATDQDVISSKQDNDSVDNVAFFSKSKAKNFTNTDTIDNNSAESIEGNKISSVAFFGHSYSHVGEAVSSAGDVDGDGFDDLIIGASGGNKGGEGSGEVFLITAADLANPDIIDGTADGGLNLINMVGKGGSYRFVGAEERDFAGISISSAGDSDGDGLDDILIGAPYADGDERSNSGETYLIAAADFESMDASDGADGVIDLDKVAKQNSSYVFYGASAYDHSGFSIASVGDIDEDGKDDILIGAPYADAGGPNSGKAYLIAAADFESMDAADDHADGVIDLKKVAMQNSSYVFNGASGGDRFGASVASAGDINGDGRRHILIGAPYAGGRSYSGKVYLIAAADLKSMDAADGKLDSVIDLNNIARKQNVAQENESYVFTGASATDRFGTSIASAGDIDGDGKRHILIGAPYADGGGNNSGEVYLIAAADLKSMDDADDSKDGVINLANVARQSSSYQLIGADTRYVAGCSVSSAGDVDGDGLDDLIIGASQSLFSSDPSNGESGSSYLILAANLAKMDGIDGSADGVIYLNNVAQENKSYVFTGASAYDVSGASIASVGDTDGDGLDDLIIGAPGAPEGDGDGEAYLIMAADLKNLDECGGNKTDDTKQDGIINLAHIGGENCQ